MRVPWHRKHAIEDPWLDRTIRDNPTQQRVKVHPAQFINNLDEECTVECGSQRDQSIADIGARVCIRVGSSSTHKTLGSKPPPAQQSRRRRGMGARAASPRNDCQSQQREARQGALKRQVYVRHGYQQARQVVDKQDKGWKVLWKIGSDTC